MTDTKSSEPQTGFLLICRAVHPRSNGDVGRFGGRIHGIRLQMVPFAVRPTHRVVRSWAEVRPGCLGVKCSSSDCRMISEYEIVEAIQGIRARRRLRPASNSTCHAPVVP